MFKHRISHGDSAIHESKVFNSSVSEFFNFYIPGESSSSVAVIYAFELLIPSCKECISLLICRLRHYENGRRSGIVVEKSLLKLRSVFVNLNFIGDTLCDAEPSHKWINRIQLFHYEHIIHRDFHNLTTRRYNLIVRIAHVWSLLHPVRWNIPQFYRFSSFVSFDEEKTFSNKKKIDFMKSPYC